MRELTFDEIAAVGGAGWAMPLLLVGQLAVGSALPPGLAVAPRRLARR